jgi:hypothetical protein
MRQKEKLFKNEKRVGKIIIFEYIKERRKK